MIKHKISDSEDHFPCPISSDIPHQLILTRNPISQNLTKQVLYPEHNETLTIEAAERSKNIQYMSANWGNSTIWQGTYS